MITVAVLTVSDRCAAGSATDTAGPAVIHLLRKTWPKAQILNALLPDEEDLIADQLMQWCKREVALVLTVGGTGLGPRDVTPEATRRVIMRSVPGLAEAIRAIGAERNPYAWLSRGIAGQYDSTLIVNLPGSRRGAMESVAAILPLLTHGLNVAAGGQTHP
jgi:molybdopterin adenylyltransferase